MDRGDLATGTGIVVAGVGGIATAAAVGVTVLAPRILLGEDPAPGEPMPPDFVALLGDVRKELVLKLVLPCAAVTAVGVALLVAGRKM
jgi:hypothetical protein